MYNKQYNTRHSGRYNTPGQFIPAGEQLQQPPLPPPLPPSMPQQHQAAPPQAVRQPNLHQIQTEDIEMKQESKLDASVTSNGDDSTRPPWMKTKLAGVRKISNKERRRRQNENLRRLLSPKNALMVLNEMMPNEQVTQQFKVEPAQVNNHFSYKPAATTFCAGLSLEGNDYKGYGDNKLAARNAVAEQAIRDIIIKKMSKGLTHEAAGGGGGSEAGEEEETLPMIQLASFALHKLFSEWEYEGHKVPIFKSGGSTSEAAGEQGGAGGVKPPKPPKPDKPRALPAAAAAMHPCMLLSQMRPGTQYAEISAEGQNPQNMVFTMGVDVDGKTYIGKASNKKEARKQAARAACQVLFGIQYTD